MAYDVADVAARFREDGFVLVEEFLSADEVDRLDQELERYMKEVLPGVDKRDVFYESGSSGAITHTGGLNQYDDYFRDFVNRPHLVGLMEACVGSQIELLGLEVFFKAPRKGTATPYHQDNAYMHFDPAEGAAFWLALDDTTVENGAMHYARGVFKLGDLDHFETNEFPFSKQQSEAPDPVKYPEVPAVLGRGSAAIHHILTPHRTGSNNTDQMRRGLVCSFKGVNAQVNEAWRASHAAYTGRLHKELGNV